MGHLLRLQRQAETLRQVAVHSFGGGEIRVTANGGGQEIAGQGDLEPALDIGFALGVARKVPARSGGDQHVRANLGEPQLLGQLQGLMRDLGIELVREHPGPRQLAQHVGLGRLPPHPVPDRQRGQHRPLRIILMRDRRPEQRHYRITDELLHRPAEPLQFGPQPRVKRRQQRTDILRVHLLGPGGEAH
jgi:hypothetical protein